MSPKTLIILLAILGLIAFGIWYTTAQTTPRVPADTVLPLDTVGIDDGLPIEAHFRDSEGREVVVLFDNHADVAIMTGLGHEALMLPRAISADGGRYENVDVGIVLWNKGNEVTITEYDTEIYRGVEVE